MPARPWDKTAPGKGKGTKKRKGKKTKDTAKLMKVMGETPGPEKTEDFIDDKKIAGKLPIRRVIDIAGELNRARKALDRKLKPYRDRLFEHFKSKGIIEPIDSENGLYYGKFETRTTVDTSKAALTKLYGEQAVRELEGELMAKGMVRKTESIVVREKNLEK